MIAQAWALFASFASSCHELACSSGPGTLGKIRFIVWRFADPAELIVAASRIIDVVFPAANIPCAMRSIAIYVMIFDVNIDCDVVGHCTGRQLNRVYQVVVAGAAADGTLLVCSVGCIML